MFKNRQYTPTAKEFKEEFCINGKWVLNSEISYKILLKEEQQRNERITKKNDKNVRRK